MKNKITNDLQELVEKFLEENQSDESKISLLKSLCWIDQMSQANKVLSSIQVPQNLNVMDKLFLRDIFNLNSFKIDETLPVKTKLEEKFEETVANLENYEIRWCGDSIETASYFKNFEIFDRNSNKKCVVQFTGLNEKFRNIGDNTNSFTFKKNHLIKLIQNENEKENCRYWIFEARKYQNLGNFYTVELNTSKFTLFAYLPLINIIK
ncbi:hypothetical protein BpHYR1_005251 [Brachionus plicatilis]|uniref:Uncharacterized protein n=1 Tax=Brachionus plicatilis TaxID=10195 RepID=A0A3M7SH12_BRAPC|nr:hypothetical protein BpHYR1_005251 [Brachionus plicatilis]